MKFSILLVGILFFMPASGHSCTIIPVSFCQTLDELSDDLVISGVITSIDSFGIDVEVIQVLRGTENRQFIRIWDGTDIWCTDIISMAAADIGTVSDTFILILPKIEIIENDWDIIGDYRRSLWPFNATELRVENGIAHGFIEGVIPAPPGFLVYSYSYPELVSSFLENGSCPEIILSTNIPISEKDIQINSPFQTTLNLTFPAETDGTIRVYSISGVLVAQAKIEAQSNLSMQLEELENGLYVVEWIGDRSRVLKKVVKQTL